MDLLLHDNQHGPRNTLKSLLSPLYFKTLQPKTANKLLICLAGIICLSLKISPLFKKQQLFNWNFYLNFICSLFLNLEVSIFSTLYKVPHVWKSSEISFFGPLNWNHPFLGRNRNIYTKWIIIKIWIWEQKYNPNSNYY